MKKWEYCFILDNLGESLLVLYRTSEGSRWEIHESLDDVEEEKYNHWKDDIPNEVPFTLISDYLREKFITKLLEQGWELFEASGFNKLIVFKRSV